MMTAGVSFKDESVEAFLEQLASKASTPGGGSAAAVMGAIGAALSSMVCNLTIGKKKYAEVEEELKGVLAQADALRLKLIAAIEEDVQAFDAVMGAYGMPKATEEEQAARKEAIQKALHLATDAPLDCARLCRDAIDLAEIVSRKGNAAVISDGGVAVLAAHAGLRSSALNVYVNAKAIEDRAFAESRLQELQEILGSAGEKTEATYELVRSQLI
ncbi:Methenyltetrahydrofolate cyclohydrolase [Granulibacter bethesdensis]|uniref:Methenyltetrahydrofolate cyclohydrolase n=2 Tax=Granulibacter bethesdensis TaxID=364410 RepID=A0AAC9K9A0_9PROT|nr:Methenyltetrahydrofolate cyclohydrolase [Granulibacter bethesdensis]APH60849.1 Methenyltetrahydrofolate cyclohydrolase [Granulibacter bethesdensis]